MTTAALRPQQSSIWWIFLLQGIAGIILRLMLIPAPGATLLVIVTFLGFYWLITGVLALVRVFVDRSIPWIWSLLTGIVGILAGLFVLRHPLVAALTVPTLIVIILGVQGTLNDLGIVDIALNRAEEARKAFEEALKIYRELEQKNPGTYLPSVAQRSTI